MLLEQFVIGIIVNVKIRIVGMLLKNIFRMNNVVDISAPVHSVQLEKDVWFEQISAQTCKFKDNV